MDEQTAELLYGLGRAEASLALLDEAAAHLSQAFDYFAQAGDVPRCTAVASVPAFVLSEAWGMAPVVERALQLVPPESVDAGWLLCLRGSYLVSKGDYEAGKALLQRAVAIAQGANDHRLELRALHIWEYAAATSLHLRDVEEASARALDLLPSVDSPWDEAGVRGAAAFLLTWIKGEVREATAQAKAALAAAERLRDRRMLDSVVSFGHYTARYAGNWAEARALSERVLAVSQVSSRMLAHTLLLECQLGNFEQAESYWQRLLAKAETVRDTLAPSKGEPDLLTAEAARIMGSRRGLASVRDSAGAAWRPCPFSLLYRPNRIALGLVAAEEQDAAQAAEEYGHWTNSSDRGSPARYTAIWGSSPTPRVWRTRPWRTSRLRSPSPARRATGRSWPGPAATTPICCASATAPATASGRRRCWRKGWSSPATWACGRSWSASCRGASF